MESPANRRSPPGQTFGAWGETAGRKVPEIVLAGDLIEAARLNRYRWVSEALPAGDVLDVGCGLGAGATILSKEGRRTVVAIDRSHEVLEAASSSVPSQVTLERADVHVLPFESRRFHGVVAFELLDRVQEPQRVLEELSRVLRPDGVLALSLPGCGAPEVGSRAPRRAFDSRGVLETLRARFTHVAVWQELAWVTLGILSSEGPAPDRREAVPAVEGPGSVPTDADATPTLLVLASMQPVLTPALVLTRPLDLDQWAVAWEDRVSRLRRAEARIEDLESSAGRIRELQTRLLEAEQAVGSLPQLHQAIRQAVDERRRLEQEARYVGSRLAAIESSHAWRITAPLRWVGGLVRRGAMAVERVERLLARMTERGLLDRVEGIVERIQRRLG